MLPDMTVSISSLDGFGLDASSAAACIICPAWQ
jgi:hypothetical protein